jgi:small conductance mechanosensitive channel
VDWHDPDENQHATESGPGVPDRTVGADRWHPKRAPRREEAAMRDNPQRRAVLAAALLLGLATTAFAQPTTKPAGPAWQPDLPAESAWLTGPSPSELKLKLAPLRLDELEARRESALEALAVVSRTLADTIIRQTQLLRTEPVDADAVAAIDAQLEQMAAYRNDLVTRVNIVLASLEAKGGDASAARSYVTSVEHLQPEKSLAADAAAPSAAEIEQQRIADRVAVAIATVRETPPVHERPQPWTVPVSELTLELQPLRKDQIDERVRKWLDILQRELRQRIRMDIALEQVEDEAERQALADESARQQEIVKAIVERIRATLLILQKRGGDTAEYRDYIANATGQRLNLTNPSVLLAQIKSWLRSPTGGIRVGLTILKFVVIIIVFWIGSRIGATIMRNIVRRIPGSSSLLHKFASDMTGWSIMIVGIVVAVSTLGVTIGPLIAAIGAAGLVIGLALQGTLSNFASGVLILISRPYDVGDVISADGVFGKVDAMNIVSTRMLTFDNQVMLVPNNQIWNGVITNLTKLDTRRVDLVYGISYGDDIGKAIEILERVVKGHPKVLTHPEPVIRVHELADSSVNFIVRPWSKTADYWDVYWDLTRQVKEAFDAEGISIPFPQRDVHLHQVAPGPAEA